MIKVKIWVNDDYIGIGEKSKEEIDDLVALLKEYPLLDGEGNFHKFSTAQFETGATDGLFEFHIMMDRQEMEDK